MLSGDIPQLREIESYVVSGARSGELRRTQVVVDPLVPMHTTERFDQWYRGVPIYGGAVVLDSERGVPVSAFGTMTPTLDITVDQALDQLGSKVAAMIQNRIRDHIPPQLAESTLERKTVDGRVGDVPLIDTGQLITHITWAVEG